MRKQVELISIFLASPGDVAEERQLARDVIDEINRTTGRDRGFRLEVIGWDTDSFASYGSDGQSLINDQIGQMEDHDLFVGILWNRFGSKTPRADSGTEEEFNRAEESFRRIHQPNIMFYFCQRPTNLRSASELEQKGKVLAFRERVQQGGLTGDYTASNEFQAKFRHDLSRWLATRTAVTPDPPAAQTATLSPSASPSVGATPAPSSLTTAPPMSSPAVATSDLQTTINDSGMWVLLGSEFFEAESVEEKNDNTIIIEVSPKNTEEDASLKHLQANQQRRGESLPYAHQNTGGIVQVLNADRKSVSGKAIWSLTLKIEPSNHSSMSEMAYSGISSEKIAVMRARLILLNESPQAGISGQGRQGDILHDTMLRSMVGGLNTRAKVRSSALPDLWKHFKGNAEHFLPLARLWSVFHLITSNTVEHILEFEVGPLNGDMLHIRFRGRRAKFYSNVDATAVAIEGDCDLSAPSVTDGDEN
jgi:hypothetical protein